jgi:hypothetical protein
MAAGNKHNAAILPGSDFLLDEAQLAAALGMLGRRPTPQSAIAHVQPASGAPGLLRNTALLDATGRLIPEFSEILEVVIDPKRQVSCVLNIAGEPRWETHQFFDAIPSKGAFVGFEKCDGEYKLVPLRGAADAATHASSLFELPDNAATPGRNEIVLDLAGYAALLAGADAVQATALRARLARAPTVKPVLTPELLKSELEKAIANPVTSWAAAAAHLVSPVKLDAVAEQITTGMATLQSAGVIRPVQRGSVFTDTGEQLAGALNSLLRISGVTLNVLYDGEWVKAAHLSLFVCADGILIISRLELSAANPSVHLLQATAADAREQIRKLFEYERSPAPLQPPVRPAPDRPAELACSACGKPVAAEARFCSWCGSDLSPPRIGACPACGKPASNVNAKFCTGCGAQFDASHQPQPRTVEPVSSRTQSPVTRNERRCPNPQCGKVVAADKNFCTSCGTRMPAER